MHLHTRVGEPGLEAPQGQVRTLTDISKEKRSYLTLDRTFSVSYFSSGSCLNANACIYRRLQSVTRTNSVTSPHDTLVSGRLLTLLEEILD